MIAVLFVVSALFASAYLVSGFGAWGFTRYRAYSDQVSIYARHGQVAYIRMKGGGPWRGTVTVGPVRNPGYDLGHALPRYHTTGRGFFAVVVPLWMPAAACVVLAALLLVTGRRRGGGRRRCGYDLSGARLRVCPECGEPIDRRG